MLQWVEQSPLHYLSLSLVSIIFLVLLFKLTRPKTPKLNLPPSPPRLPIIGNLHQLSSLPHRGLQALARKHGPLMMVHFGKKQLLIVSSSEAAREMMKTQDHIFSGRPGVKSTDRQVDGNKALAYAPYGEYWRQLRKVAVFQLLSASRVESFRSVREEEVELLINKIRQSSPSPVNLSELLISFTNDVICRIALGRKFDRKFLKLVQDFSYIYGAFNVGTFIPWLAWVNIVTGYNARVKKMRRGLYSFCQNVIDEHIQRAKNGGGGDEAVEDFVDVLLGIEKDGSLSVPFGKENIKALILDMFFGGTDTSSTTLVWAMIELIRHPEIMKEVQTEIREIGKGKPYITEDDVGQMHKMKIVIKETLRLHVPAPLLLPRASTEDTKLLGYDIPSNTGIMINAWAIAMDPVAWENPEEFRPKRFLNSSTTDYKGQDFDSIPFGAGRRGCPGIHLATQNMDLPLANLLYLFDWTTDDVGVGESPGVVIHRNPPLLAMATPYNF